MDKGNDMPEEATPRKSTAPRRAIPATQTWRVTAMNETQGRPVPDPAYDEAATALRPAVTGPQRALPALIAPTISLPALPRTTTQPKMPAVLPPHLVRPDNKMLQKHPTHPVTVVPSRQQSTHPLRAVPPPPRPGAKARNHRLAIAATLGVILTIMLIFVPIAHGAGFSLPGIGAQASLAEYPTVTPTPVPIYPAHPVASGVGDFICVALPFARLVQQRELQAGLAHPWYVSVILAQWGIEQGWNIPGYTGYNWGNSSAIPGFPAVGGINVPGSPSAFAYAYNPLQGVDIYVVFTQMNFYTGITAAYPNGAIAQAIAMGESPWDAGHYAEGGGGAGASLVNVIREFNLQRFDNPSVMC